MYEALDYCCVLVDVRERDDPGAVTLGPIDRTAAESATDVEDIAREVLRRVPQLGRKVEQSHLGAK